MTRAPRRPRDTNQLAKFIVDLSTGEKSDERPDEGKDQSAVARGRLGGIKGGKARRKALSEERRREIARKAAAARWKEKQ